MLAIIDLNVNELLSKIISVFFFKSIVSEFIVFFVVESSRFTLFPNKFSTVFFNSSSSENNKYSSGCLEIVTA